MAGIGPRKVAWKVPGTAMTFLDDGTEIQRSRSSRWDWTFDRVIVFVSEK